MTSSENAISALLATVRKLAGPEGCPWDRQQTLASLAPFAVEEAWELLDAARSGRDAETREELGDLLMLILLACVIAENEGRFTLDQTAGEVNAKLTRRHPHVFGGAKVSGADDVVRNWELVKRSERKQAGEAVLPELPASLPALTQAFKLGKAASRLGFDWPDLGGPLAKIIEEWEELKEAVARNERAAVEEEAGDLLFAITNLCRATSTDPEEALRAACRRFRDRFERVVREGGPRVLESLASMESLWRRGKEHGGGS